ncbi:TPA: sodium:calcium antiporter, partial [Candidatus Spyradomonas excrementavium]|nr:sodium:calcium antiporter [Candidatus Spyradomonas excrementavium]
MLIHAILLIAMLFAIVGSCVVFTNAIEHLGKACNLNDGAVGSILAAIGTALPETIVPLVAIFGAYLSKTSISTGQDIGIGAILGSPFLLSTLAMFVTGAAVLVFSGMKIRAVSMKTDYKIVFRDLRFFIISYSVAILAGFVGNYPVKCLIAAFLLTYYLIYVFRTINRSLCEIEGGCELEELYFQRIFRKYNIFVIGIQIILAIGALIYFSHVFVLQITYFSHVFHLNPLILSLFLAPVATELPEMFNSVIWSKSAKDTLALGNITGAMVFQSCIPTSIGILLTPWVFNQTS